MGKVIKVAEIERACPGTSRDVAREVAKRATPGCVIDFSDFALGNNSFADEFIMRFVEKFGWDALREVVFKNMSPLLKSLLKRAVTRRRYEMTAWNTKN